MDLLNDFDFRLSSSASEIDLPMNDSPKSEERSVVLVRPDSLSADRSL